MGRREWISQVGSWVWSRPGGRSGFDQCEEAQALLEQKLAARIK